MADLMYTPLENIFAATMAREGKTVKAWSNGKEFTAFFRRCDNAQSTEDRINKKNICPNEQRNRGKYLLF